MPTPPLTAPQLARELGEQIKTLQRSYREVDGRVRDAAALKSIRALNAAIAAIKGPRSTVHYALLQPGETILPGDVIGWLTGPRGVKPVRVSPLKVGDTVRKNETTVYLRPLTAECTERTCVYCGCTDSRACPGGCSWVFTHPATLTGICSTCFEATHP